MRIAAATLLTLAVLAVAGCNKAETDTVDDTALQAINESVAADLNAAPAAIVQLLKTLDKPTPIGLESLQVSLDQTAVPVDWWLLQHGLILVIEPAPTPGRPTFLVSPTGSQLAASAPVWFSAAAGTPSRVDCHSPNVLAAGGCEVEVTVLAQPTDAGAAILGAGANLDPIKVQAIVAQNAEGWQVRELHTEGTGLRDFALNALLGKDAARNAARQQVLANLNLGQAVAGAAGPAATLGTGAFGQETAPPPVEIIPVAPVVGESAYVPRRLPGGK